MDDIERMPHTGWFDRPHLSGLTGEEISQHLAATLLDPYTAAAGLGVEPILAPRILV